MNLMARFHLVKKLTNLPNKTNYETFYSLFFDHPISFQLYDLIFFLVYQELVAKIKPDTKYLSC